MNDTPMLTVDNLIVSYNEIRALPGYIPDGTKGRNRYPDRSQWRRKVDITAGYFRPCCISIRVYFVSWSSAEFNSSS